jgi:hypothetical protein
VKVRLLAPAGASVAVGGGGLGRFLVHVCIWHLIWRAALALCCIPTFGPVIVVVLVIALVAAGAGRFRHGTISPGGRYGYGTGDGPRGWWGPRPMPVGVLTKAKADARQSAPGVPGRDRHTATTMPAT